VNGRAGQGHANPTIVSAARRSGQGAAGRRGLDGRISRTRCAVVLFPIMVIAVLALGASSAHAALSFPFDGQLAPAGGSFEENRPNAIAISDSSGKAYVAAAAEVDVFELAGEVELAPLDGGETPAGSFGTDTVDVAADDQSGAVYVLDRSDGVVDEFDAAGSYVCQITGSPTPSASECNGVAGSATPSAGFSTPGGLAVDQETGEIYVGDADHEAIDVFSGAGAFVRAISLAPVAGELFASEPQGIAVDDANGRVYMSNVLPAVVFVFTKSGEYQTTMDGSNTPEGSFGAVAIVAVAVDNQSGRLFVSTSAQSRVDVFAADGEYLPASFARPFNFPRAVAVDQETHRVFVGDAVEEKHVAEIFGPAQIVPTVATEPAGPVGPHGATLNGSVDPAEVQLTECFFQWGPTEGYGQIAPCVPAAGSIAADSNSHPVSAEITGLQAGTTYHFRLVAANANGPGQGADQILQTPPPPAIAGVGATDLTSEGAGLIARINPQGFDTTYHFEYGTDTSYGVSVPVPDGDIGSGSTPVAVEQHVSGLVPGITYHYRVLATNADGTTTSPDHVFVFLAPEGGPSCPNEALRSGLSAGLPECRAYEMVTPAQKNGALIGAITFGAPADIASDGGAVILGADQCFADAASCVAERQTNGTPFTFSRGAEGWTPEALTPSAEAFETNTWWNYDAGAGTALFSMPLTPGGSDQFYAREPGGSFRPIGPLSPPEAHPSFGQTLGSVVALATTSDISHVVYDANPFWPFSESIRSKSLYEYVGRENAEPLLVGVSGGQGSHDLISACESILGELNVTGSALSADGRIVYFTAGICGSGTGANASTPVPVDELFARIDNETAGAHTVAISQPLALAGGASDTGCTTVSCLENVETKSNWRDAAFQRGSTDGSKVFFTDTQQLTNEATQDPVPGDTAASGQCPTATGPNGCNLYLYDAAGTGGRHLIDVSAAGSPTSGGPRVQGVVAVSPDASHAYFVARGVLTTQANGFGESAEDGAENLYAFTRNPGRPSGRLAFVATLPESDLNLWRNANDLANVTPDGRYLVFSSRGALTPDLTRTDGAAQIYRYDSQTGALIRISVGERGFNDDGNGGIGDASIVPGLVGFRHIQVRPDPTMSDDGSRIFFMSSVALTPGALESVLIGNGPQGEPDYAQNVYEWHGGQVSLISDGRDTNSQPAELCAGISSVCLIGTDPTGEDVFFGTADQLVAQDTDTQEDIYDARVGGGFAAPAEPAPCEGEGCKGPSSPAPASSTPGTATFSGPPDPAPKHAKKKHKHKKHHKKKHHHKRGHKSGASANHASHEQGGQK
jgi:hypothetical protein